MTPSPIQIHLVDAAATARLAWLLAPLLKPGDCIALCGDLGAGKTAFATAVAAGLGISQPVTSPTFALVHSYAGGRLPMWHADLYRLERAAELVELGLDEIIDDGGGVVVVEWADRFPTVMPRDHVRVELTIGVAVQGSIEVAEGRDLLARGTGARGHALVAAWAAAIANAW